MMTFGITGHVPYSMVHTGNNHIGQSRDGPRPRRPNEYLQTLVLFDIIMKQFVLTDDNDIHKIIIIHFSQFIWL